MTDDGKQRLIIVGSLGKVTRREIQLRAICNFYRADADYGTRIANGLIIDLEAEMAQRGAGRPNTAGAPVGQDRHGSALRVS